ncbi:I78 family peptidase inhibitor [Pseudomonas sp. Marseille-Q5115]|uniref:I78 family peptidase inhibitor n=1 Tax=Pseudomonas sp. Marseille-Q5115 TaxID=2866593 RepID=UPI001CE3D6BD|nr:I78 family peptidase inhibitor [Pseudomonas sp. Marseille-Q5115]
MGLGKTGLAIAALALAGGCSTSTPLAPASTAAPTVEAGRCSSEAAQFAVGQQASQALLEQAKVRSGSLMARILGPHDPVTMDYRSERLNLNADDSGKIVRANCG